MTRRTKERSPYRKHHKTPYPYHFKRCSHTQTHLEHLHGARFQVCDVCNIICENLGPERAETVSQETINPVLQAA